MSISQVILGFDARTSSMQELSEVWPAERKSQFLVNPAVKIPCSIDRNAWPSIFQFAENQHSAGKGHIRIPNSLVDPRINNLYLWSDLKKMLEFLSGQNTAKSSFRVVCYTILSDEEFARSDYFSAVLFSSTNPSMVLKEWKCLGFDVADQYFISGLSNCGFATGERVEIDLTWRKMINRFGLFSKISEANEFCLFSNHRVREHAPFFVYGIYEIPFLG